jgi:hypothetical protein
VSNSVKEILLVAFIVLVPTVPVTIFLWGYLGRRRARRGLTHDQEIESGRSPATPFAMISIVGSVIAVAALAMLVLVVVVRAIAA